MEPKELIEELAGLSDEDQSRRLRRADVDVLEWMRFKLDVYLAEKYPPPAIEEPTDQKEDETDV